VPLQPVGGKPEKTPFRQSDSVPPAIGGAAAPKEKLREKLAPVMALPVGGSKLEAKL
jgi:hypothetical protein